MKNYMKLRYFSFLILFLLFASSLRAEYFRYIGLSEGLTQLSVMAIHQDKLGRMWFGTMEGISQYDGNRVRVFKGWAKAVGDEAPVWLGNKVSYIVGDSQDNIYFCIDNDLVRYDIHTEKFVRLSDDYNIQILTSFEGQVWYMQHDSLYCIKEKDAAPVFTLKANITAQIRCLTMLEDKICIGTFDGAFLIDRRTGQRTHLLPGIEIYRFFESSQKELWIGTRMQGLYRMGKDKNLTKVPYSPGSPEGISSHQIRDFVEDNDGNIWFGTFDGLQKYSAGSQQYSLIQIPQYVGGLTHPSIFSLYKDVAGTIWVGSYYGGVNYFSPQHDSFVHYDYGRNRDSYYSYIGEIVLDKEEHLWLSTDGGGISCVDKKWNILQQFTAGGSNSIPHNNVKSICYDEANNSIYIGTYLGGLSRYDQKTGRFYNYWQMGNHSSDAPNDVIFHIKMWKDRVFVSARNGLFCLDTRTQTFSKLSVPFAYYEYFDIDPAGNLYAVGWRTVLHTNIEHPGPVVYIPLPKEESKSSLTRVLATEGGAYIGTLGIGLFYYDRQTEKLTHYTAENSQLSSNFCYGLSRTKSGKILITGDKGVTSFDPAENTFTTIDLMSNFPSTHIINGCGIFVSGDQSIYIGDTKGVTVFSENEFTKTSISNNKSIFYFSELWINNKMIVPKDDTDILAQSLPYTNELQLDHDQNNLVIHFSLSEYQQQLSEKWFQYKLEGFDKKWIKTKQTALYYTNLDPGTYTLRVSLVNEKESKDAKEITMQIVIASPWYNTWWSWAIYVSIVIACVFYYVYSKIAKRTLALSLEKERFEKQQIEQLNHEKLVFFTNVSHEFRTPLTLIISHIDMLLQNYSLNPSIYNQISKVRKNAQKMNNLISELLEFRKLGQNYGTLQMKQQDIMVFLKEIYLSFADYAQQRNIAYTFDVPETAVRCWFEPQLMEKVFYNLLSNAFKYTSDKGSITVTAEVTDNKLEIRITDTGIGIAKQDTDKIFARFFQGSNQEKKDSLFGGTGIGLALTRTIVERHHGVITVKSAIGEGSTFIVKLPLQKEVLMADKNIQFSTEEPQSDIIPDSLPVLMDESTDSPEPANDENKDENPRTLLLVEDNDELLLVLKELFEPFYKIYCAHNGKEGLNLAYEKLPDLIISDVMMPEMTGTEMCLQIKNNIDLCHIPVILLTALSSVEQNIEGLNRGADDYITKPFHAQLLLARANNLIRSRLLVQHQFDKKPISEIDLASINPLDKDLLKRTSQAIEQHIDDTEFDIPALCKEVGVGRSLLYTKFKALTGMTPNNFLLNYRLKHAATLLQQYPDLPIAEVSDRSGFNTPVYFSRCFKSQYGCTPQVYRKEKK